MSTTINSIINQFINLLKNNKILALVLLILLISGGFGAMLNIISPGPEGVDVRCYGVQSTNSLADNTELHLVSQTFPGTQFSYIEDDGAGHHNITLTLSSTLPKSTTVTENYNYCWYGALGDYHEDSMQLNFLSEIRRPQFYEINQKGDPLGIRGASEIVWQSWETSPNKTVTTTQNSTVTELRWTKYGAYLVPVDFEIDLSCLAGIKGSWGEVKDLTLWYVIDTVYWYNAFASTNQLAPAETPEGAVLQTYQYHGAFPIYAWVGAWDGFTINDENNQKWESIPQEVNAYLQINPSIEGREITLYHEPNYIFQEILSSEVWQNPSLITGLEQRANYPDPRFAETVFFPIQLQRFGALKQSQWEGVPWLSAIQYYYPSASLRARLLYLVWGEWTYLWTQEEANEQGYVWKPRNSTIEESESGFSQFWGGFQDVFMNPYTMFYTILIVVILFVVFFGGGKIVESIFRKKSGGS